MFSRRISVLTSSLKNQANRYFHNSSKQLGGHGHGHGHGAPHAPKEPYAPTHHQTYPEQAHLFGIDPAVGYQKEGWEWITYLTYIACFGIMAVAWSSTPYNQFSVRIVLGKITI
jgi:hypothetical protein